MAVGKTNTSEGLTGLDRKRVIRTAILAGLMGVVTAAVVFGGAGRLDWINGWVFVVLWFATKTYSSLRLLRHDPRLLAERVGKHDTTKPWDRVIIPVYMVLAFVTFLLASLDGGNYGWSGPMAAGFNVLGSALYLVGTVVASWAMDVNTYHSSVSRIQADRGQQVVSSGPYAVVRHPTYAVSVLIWLATPLILDSWLALIPAALTGAMMVLRTVFEDRMLREELPGYREYAACVRYRLLPGVW